MTQHGTPRPAGTATNPDADARDFVVEVVREHATTLLVIARRYSLCADDAYDAYQRALEIFLRRAPEVERETAVAWLRTVIKHEALAVRAARQTSVNSGEVDLDLQEARRLPSEDEQVVRFDRVTRAAEALQRLKPHEITALVLRAEGHTYQEICDHTGWSYTKVNRCITEGRRRFIERYEHIESGAECERWAPLLAAMADGEASSRDVVELRPHLRSCAACRAVLRESGGAPRQVAAIVPVGAVLASTGVASAHGSPGWLMRIHEALSGGLHERAAGSVVKAQAAIEAASTGKLAVVAAASTAALAGGGLFVEQRLERPAARPVAHAARPHHHRLHARRVALRLDAQVETPAHGVIAHPPAAPEAHPSPVAYPAPVARSEPSAPASSAAPAPATPAPAPTPAREFAPEQASSSSSSAATSRSASRPAPAPRTTSGSSGSSTGEFGP